MNILLLGITSWIGVRLSKELTRAALNVTGTTRNINKITFPIDAHLEECKVPSDYLSLIRGGEFDVVVNLLRGEDSNNFLLHKNVIKTCSSHGILYCYASSALALNGYPFGQYLTENLIAKSDTPYGKYKAKCESEIFKDKNLRYLILRFSSIQGWPEHKFSRNALFFKKIISNKEVYVDRGVFQNRLYDGDFVAMVKQLFLDKKEGTYHLGALDSSEEYEFLKRVCQHFDYSTSLIVSGKQKKININVISQKFFKEYPNYSLFEEDTIKKLYADAPPWVKQEL